MSDWNAQETGARAANELAAPRLRNSGNVDRILWNHGRDTIDEIVVRDCTIHLEQMSNTYYWMAIYKGDGRFVVNLSHAGRKPLECTGYDDTVGAEWHWDQDEEHA